MLLSLTYQNDNDMKEFTGYAIWDNKSKSWVYDSNGEFVLSFPTIESANEWIEDDLGGGNYPDEPMSVYDVRAYNFKDKLLRTEL